ncbi:MAG: phospholipase D-like domain-containing protein [Sphingomonadales bacterium]
MELKEGHNCWRTATADRLSVIVDADDYFRHARQAFLNAQRRIMLVGWDFDARIALVPGERLPDEPEGVGEFLYWLVERNPRLELYLLRWDLGALKSLFRGTTILTVMKWMRHPRIHTKLDGHHPPGASHHQKLVAIDEGLAFCGGIDMTGDRWDTRAHRDGDPGRRRPNGSSYKPWHDATVAVSGPAAAMVAQLCRDRWLRATGAELTPVSTDDGHWPDDLKPMMKNVSFTLARTCAPLEQETGIFEVEALFLDQIAGARKFIYFESQYFASRKVAEALARRLDEADGPEVVIVNPVSAQGWLEPLAMDSARERLMEALRRHDRNSRLRMYHPVTAGGTPIYVHAKIAIIDDRQLRVGSANLNNRSMRLDTEADALVDASHNADPAVGRAITALRDDLLAEHLGVDPLVVSQRIAETGSMIQTIESLRGSGRTLVPYEPKDLTATEAWLADNEILDPEGPGEMFEALSKRGLFRRLGRPSA